MKILLLHFSDLHIRDSSVANDIVIERIINGITNLKFEEVVILFSGDIAYSGIEVQYRNAKFFIGKLIKRLKKFIGQDKKIYVLPVPGNHDINFNNIGRIREDIIKLQAEKCHEKELNKDIGRMKDFFDFANYQSCFMYDKLIDIKLLHFNESIIQVNLINSAPFSCLYTLEDRKKVYLDNEKGLHYLPAEKINMLIPKDNSSLCLTVMHHSPEWFLEDIRWKLQEIIFNSSNIVLMGHDHFYQSDYNFHEGEHEVALLKGGTLFTDVVSDAFNAIVFDTETYCLNVFSLKWDDLNKFYICQKKPDRFLEKAYSYKGFHPNKEFIVKMQTTDLRNESFHKTFIFPNLVKICIDEYDEPAKVEDFSQFLKQIDGKQLCLIEGAELSGKSQILKYLYFEEFKYRIPLYIDIDDHVRIKDIENLLWDAFQLQYSKDYVLFKKYHQLNRDEKIILIDNIDKLKDKESFLGEISSCFHQVIATSSIQQIYDIKNAITEKYNKDARVVYRIEPFYLIKRKELIQKTCEILCKDQSGDFIYRKVEEINNFIQEQIKVFSLYPFFIINYCNHYINKVGNENNKLNSFSIVFENSIRETLLKQNDIDVSVALAAMVYVAFEIAVNRIYPLSIPEFNNLLKKYCIDAKKNINPVIFMNLMVNAKVLKYYDNDKKIKFCSESVLAYLIAKKLLSLAFEPVGQELISHLIENSCFGLNAEILMFLCSLTDSETLFKFIIEKVKTLIDEIDEWGFEKRNLTFFDFEVKEKFVKEITRELVKSEEKRIEENEKVISKKSYEVIDLFDYSNEDLNKFINKEIRLIKNLTLLASIFSNFEQSIFGKLKDLFIQELFVQPNKIIYYLFKPFDKEINELIEKEIEYRKKQKQLVKRNQVLNEFIDIASVIILNLYNEIARRCTTKETIKYFEDFMNNNKENSNYLIEYIIMSENINNINVFGLIAEELYKNTNRQIIKNMIKCIFNKHFIWNRVPKVKYAQYISSVYLGDGQPTNMRKFLSLKHKNKK